MALNNPWVWHHNRKVFAFHPQNYFVAPLDKSLYTVRSKYYPISAISGFHCKTLGSNSVTELGEDNSMTGHDGLSWVWAPHINPSSMWTSSDIKEWVTPMFHHCRHGFIPIIISLRTAAPIAGVFSTTTCHLLAEPWVKHRLLTTRSVITPTAGELSQRRGTRDRGYITLTGLY